MKAWFMIMTLLIGTTLYIPLQQTGECEIDTAWLNMTPPNSVKITQLDSCGGIICWSQYMIFTDTRKIVSKTRVCSEHNYGQRFYTVPPEKDE